MTLLYIHHQNIGAIFGSSLSMKDHIKVSCKAGMFRLRNIAFLRKYLPHDDAETLIHAFVTPRIICFCNSLLYGAPSQLIQKLQSVQNSAARLVSRTKGRDQITPVLERLHWLKIQCSIQYNIILDILLTYKCLKIPLKSTFKI